MTFPDALSGVADAPAGTDPLGGSTPTHTGHHQELVDAINETQAAVLFRARADELIFDAVAYGAAVDGSTDDTAAWQAAIDACAAAGGGVVTSSKPGVSVIAGALQDTGGANAQLTLPQFDYADAEAVPIVIAGPVPPAVVPSVIGATPVPDRHLVLKSTLSSGSGALLGAVGPAGTFGSFTNVHLFVEDVGFRMASNPTNSCLDLRRVANVSMRRVVVDAGSFNVDGLTQPTTTTSYGIRCPGSDNGARVYLEQVDVVGFNKGFEFAEHATGHNVSAWGCVVAAVFLATNHASVFSRFMAVHCTYGLRFTGAHAVDVWQFAIEHAASGWNATTYDVDDSLNYGKGFVRWWAVLEGVGAHDSFVKNGGSNVTASRVGAAIGSGGGSATYFYRDRLTAAASNNILTLGATPLANSPTVWIDDALMWPTDDYTISGATITLNTPLSGGEEVSVTYASAASTASASTLSHAGAVDVQDDFNRSDSTTTLGATSVGSKTWSVSSAPWGITSNRAYLVSGGVGVQQCWVDAESADVTVSAKLAVVGSSTNKFYGLWVRADGAGNGYLIQVNQDANQLDIQKRTSGSNSAVASAVPYTPAAGDVLSVVLSGSSFTVKVNGVTKVTGTDSTYLTATRHGLWNYNSGNGVRFDDFSIQA